ncbi:hypothetical protein DDZ14_16035 [Maritimibacter sp. 55A14]|uniref:hypothetical protein n=1 Tax=Maritimibacter sp. 55A14 TaxID=2174844 RepID=UPI000D6161A4|nr:hypothetical protein [Maritimibacter sp. 55A14]PWE29950.1 hypothetical protein DDZ14_16035 [Maritimibacter sp. 55A14]
MNPVETYESNNPRIRIAVTDPVTGQPKDMSGGTITARAAARDGTVTQLAASIEGTDAVVQLAPGVLAPGRFNVQVTVTKGADIVTLRRPFLIDMRASH